MRAAQQKTETKVKGMLPAKYDSMKAIIGIVIALAIFGLGFLTGKVLPWWVGLIVAAALGFGAFVGTAWLDSYFQCRPFKVKAQVE